MAGRIRNIFPQRDAMNVNTSGISASNCKSIISICGHCAVQGHNRKDCDRKTSPPSGGGNCPKGKDFPALILERERYASTIDYGE